MNRIYESLIGDDQRTQQRSGEAFVLSLLLSSSVNMAVILFTPAASGDSAQFEYLTHAIVLLHPILN